MARATRMTAAGPRRGRAAARARPRALATAILLTGSLSGVGGANLEAEAHRLSDPLVARDIGPLAAIVPAATAPAPGHRAPSEPVAEPVETGFVPLVRIVLAPSAGATPQPVAAPEATAAREPSPGLSVAGTQSLPLPRLVSIEPVPPALSPSGAGDPGPAQVIQLASVDEPSAYVPQVTDSAAESALALPERVAAMQVALPPVLELTAEERRLMLAEAPQVLTVRVGEAAVGKVAFHMTDGQAMSVQLSGLLDALAGSFAPDEFVRLRDSEAAKSFVSLERLRAAGIDVRYDPVYDELRVG